MSKKKSEIKPGGVSEYIAKCPKEARTAFKKSMIRLKRVYEKPEASDGYRILVDRLWPRGLTKEKAEVDLWLKDLGPSTELRKWFGHDPAKWAGFKAKYEQELKGKKELLRQIRAASKKGAVTLIYGARDTEHNEALIIKEYLGKNG